MHTDSFIINIKTEGFYADDVNRPLPTEKNKAMGLMKDELGGKIMKELSALRPKTYSYLIDDDNSGKKTKGTKKCVMKKCLNLMVLKIAS